MFTISSVVAVTSTATDPNTIYIILGIIVVVLILIGSSATAAKRVVKKYYCPHCHREITFTALPVRPMQHYPPVARRQGRNMLLANQSQRGDQRFNAPLQRTPGKRYCPYCKREIIWS